MKKILIGLILALLLFPNIVKASGSINVSTTKISVVNGKTVTFSITANNAAGIIKIKSHDNKIATINKSSVFVDSKDSSKKKIVVKVTGKSVGSTKIDIILDDVGTYDEKELTGTKTIVVNVVKPTKTTTTKTTTKKDDKTDTKTKEDHTEEETPKDKEEQNIEIDDKKNDNNMVLVCGVITIIVGLAAILVSAKKRRQI